MTEKWFMSSQRMTVKVTVRDGIIIDAAPVVRKFVGQPIKNLEAWMRRHGGFRMTQLS